MVLCAPMDLWTRKSDWTRHDPRYWVMWTFGTGTPLTQTNFPKEGQDSPLQVKRRGLTDRHALSIPLATRRGDFHRLHGQGKRL